MLDPNKTMTFMVEDANIFWRNFSGQESQWNSRGERNFCVELTDDVAEQMAKDEWNVKYTKPRDEGDEPTPFIQVAVRFDIRPPRVVLLTDNSRTQLDEASVGVLDWADIRTADLIARSRYWNFGGKEGYKAYLQSLFVTIEEDALERKYQINEIPPS